MKRIASKTLILAGLSLGIPLSLVGQGMSTPTPPTSTSPSAADRPSATDRAKTQPGYEDTRKHAGDMKMKDKSLGGAVGIERVTKEDLDRRTTAKSIIGKAVYGSDGEKLGDISDITLGREFGLGVAAGSAMTSATSAAVSADSRLSTSPSASGSLNRPVTDRASTSTADRANTSASSDMRGLAGSMHADMRGAQVIISVGGLLGVGDSLVSAPISSLNYDHAQDRYTLAVRKAEFIAFAEKKTASY